MRAPDRRRLLAVAGSAAALVAAVVLGVVVPGTSSAFTAAVTNSSDTAASKTVFTCGDLFSAQERKKTAYFEYGLREDGSATSAQDSSVQGNTGTYEGSHGTDSSTPRACPNDSGSTYVLDGSSSRVTTSTQIPSIRGDFSVEVWFKTTTASEKIVGFEQLQTGRSDHYDKHLYVDSGGYLVFGIYNGAVYTISSASTSTTVTDGAWHQAVATSSSTDGSVLYLDGVRVAARSDMTVAEDYDGYWRIGEGHLQGWPDAPYFSWFTGSLAYTAAYGRVATADEVRAAYTIGMPRAATSARPVANPTRAPATLAPAPQDTSTSGSQ